MRYEWDDEAEAAMADNENGSDEGVGSRIAKKLEAQIVQLTVSRDSAVAQAESFLQRALLAEDRLASQRVNIDAMGVAITTLLDATNSVLEEFNNAFNLRHLRALTVNRLAASASTVRAIVSRFK